MFNQDFILKRVELEGRVLFRIDIEGQDIQKYYDVPKGPYSAEDAVWDFFEYVKNELDIIEIQ